MKEESLKSKLLVPVISIILSGIIGSGLTVLFNYLDWKARTQFEEEKINTATQREEIQRIVQLCHKRYNLASLTQRYLSSGDQRLALQTYEKYQTVKEDWNYDVYINRILLKHHFGEGIANHFADENGIKGQASSAPCVHTEFVALNKEMWRVMKNIEKDSPILPKTELQAYRTQLAKTNAVLEVFYEKMFDLY